MVEGDIVNQYILINYIIKATAPYETIKSTREEILTWKIASNYISI